jgi:hypothetical protein
MSIRPTKSSAPWLVCGLLSLSGCSGSVGDPATGGTGPGSGGNGQGVGGTGNVQTSGGQAGMGQANGGMGVAQGGSQSAGAGMAGSAGDDPYVVPPEAPLPVLVPAARLARLSRQQWTNTVRDLLKLTDISEIDKGVSGDALVGFDNEADALYVGEMLREELAMTADAAALANLVPADAPADLAGRARAFVSSFGLRAFRRPLSEEEITKHLALFNQGPTLYPGADAFVAGANIVIQAMLQSPHFLYRTELSTAAAGATTVKLNDYEVASKLSYAITNTMPDPELFAAAAAGQLQDPAGVASHAQRLIDGPGGTVGLNNFQMQVFRLGTYDGITRDPAIFPDFTTNTPAAMKREVLEFLDWIFREGKGVRDFYTSPVGFVTAPLAPLYGLSGTFAADVSTKVDLDPTLRSGILTQPGFLSSYISGEDPDIIHRGVFIATRVLCVELPPPSPRATPLPAFEPNMTNRERVEKTTGVGTCGEGCHSDLINPLGYAFENYDAIGKFRTVDHDKPVVASSTALLDGAYKDFTNGVELSHLLADTKETHACYAQKLMSYLHGRRIAAQELPLVDYYARVSRVGMISLRNLEQTLVTSDAFLNRLP